MIEFIHEATESQDPDASFMIQACDNTATKEQRAQIHQYITKAFKYTVMSESKKQDDEDKFNIRITVKCQNKRQKTESEL